ncbi:hypothetical protein F4780DRAFT_762388, partial [Xylariomycetidae sp. FL0641]
NLGQDDFWAPDSDTSAQPSRKRPSGKEWLKNRPAKRQRPSSSQDTAPVSSPTPMAPVKPLFRSVSAPTNIVRNKESSLAMNPKHSFKMTTPSSSADPDYDVSHSEKPMADSTPLPPIVTTTGSRGQQKTHSSSKGSGIPDNEGGCSGTAELTKTGTAMPFQQDAQTATGHRTRSSGEDHEPRPYREFDGGREERPSFQSCEDRSFQYWARPSKQAVSRDLLDVTNSPCLQLTQTGTPDSSQGREPVIASSAEEPGRTLAKDATAGADGVPAMALLSSPRRTSQTIDEHAGEEIVAGAQESVGPWSSSSQGSGSTACGHTSSPEPTVDETARISHAPDDNFHGSPASDDRIRSIREATVAGDTTMPSRNCPIEPMVDEGSTLIGDSVDATGTLDLQTDTPISGAQSEGNTTRVHAQPAAHAKPDGLAKPLETEPVAELSPATNQVTMSLSPTEQDIEAVDRSLAHPEVTEEPIPEPARIKTECISEHNEGASTPLRPAEPVPPVPRQSPWVYEPVPGAPLGIKHIKSEPVDDDAPFTCTPPLVNLMSSQSMSPEHSAVRLSQQSPWVGEPTPFSGLNERAAMTNMTIDATPVPTKFESRPVDDPQTPWIHYPESTMSQLRYPSLATEAPETRMLGPPTCIPALELQPESLEVYEQLPATPWGTTSAAATPEPDVTVKSFAKFYTPSSGRRTLQSALRSTSGAPRRGILSSFSSSDPFTNARSSRRVAFGSLPGHGEDAENLSLSHAVGAASPSPQMDFDEGDEDFPGQNRGHFGVMSRRARICMPQLRLKDRLLPTSSQEKLMSPAVQAMAQAFQAADAFQPRQPMDKTGPSAQSPWRKESQGVDDVAAVLGHLDEFIDPWDVDAAVDDAREEQRILEEEKRQQRGSEMGILFGTSIWN